MIESIAIFYHEKNPLGRTQHRADIMNVLPSDPETKIMIRKAVAFLLKFDRDGFSNCDAITFHYSDATSLCVTCEDYRDAEARILTVEPVNQSPYYTESKYRIDATTLRNELYKRIGTLEEAVV